MSTEATLEILSKSSDETESIARRLSKNLKAGDVLELVADLGGGKTTFVKGLAEGLGCKHKISSPSFTLVNQYDCGDMTLFHYDFYRLNEPGIIQQTLLESLHLPGALNVIEWPQSIKKVLPKNSIKISFKFSKANDQERKVIITADEKLIKSLRLKA